jgi:SPP1 gp7 family putative phage head morphogenesis protein
MSFPSLKKLDTHERTVVSVANDSLEVDLSYKLNAICKIIRTLIKSDQSIRSVDQLRAFGLGLDAEVYDIIRSYVQQSFELGTKYVSDIARVEPRLTTRDIDLIKLITDNYVLRFWGRVQLQVFQLKISDSGLIEEMTLPNDSFNPNFIVNSLSIAITSQALNEATKTKAGELLPPSPIISTTQPVNMQPPVTGLELQAGTTYKSLKQRIVERYGNVKTQITPENITITPPPIDISGVVYMWVTTIDERTCPLCMSLHGQTWDISEVDSIPDIPDSTHYSCRCRVMLVESSFAANVAEQQATL